MTDNSKDKIQLPQVLLDYFRRIGAEVLNFRRGMVKEHKGPYYVERSLIKIEDDGTISSTNKMHAPTKEEADAIKAALAAVDFPRSIGATEAAVLSLIKNSGKDADFFFAIRSRKDAKIIMVQERRNLDDGSKIFVPWTLWSDGHWRQLEPEGKLPFWKPREKRSCARIMVHEGAKAARYVDWLVNDRSKEAKEARELHPWANDLALYEHWGMIGGALAPHRSDYSEIKREAPMEVIYVCDNDWPGRQALKDFSRHYGATLKGIQFHQTWPESWDMADPIPQKLFFRGRYNGPGIKALIIPATQATELLPNPAGTGRPITVIRDAFAQEWLHSITPEAFIHKDWPNDILSAAEFNSRVRPFSDVDDVARLLLGVSASKSRRLHYLPGEPSGLMGNNAIGAFINTYCPSDIKPEKGDVSPFIEYMEHLVPEENDRAQVYRWAATLIARPKTKVLYGLLMISEAQGVGKTTLGEKILAPLMGMDNVSFPSETDIVESQFNSWIAHKRLAVVNEIYAGASAKAYNKLKSVITDRRITVNKKHMPTYEIENWLHIYACSNSERALKLSLDDRRWFVPKITSETRDEKYWTDFNNWLEYEGGLSKIAKWAEEYLLDNRAVMPGETAPMSEAKKAMIEESLSPGQVLVAGLLDYMKQKSSSELVFTTDVKLIDYIKTNLYEGRNNERLEKPATIRRLAKARGWYIGEMKSWHFSPPNQQGRIIAADEATAKRMAAELAREGKKDFDYNRLGTQENDEVKM